MVDKNEQKALDDIERCGRHILNVLEDDEYPNFSYSIGINQTLNKPELIIVGLKKEIAHPIINDYYDRLNKGEIFEPGNYYGNFLDGCEVLFIDVAEQYYESHMGWCRWIYKGNKFNALQLVYPTTDGIWPWDKEADESYRWWQRILNDSGELTNAI